MKKILKIVLAVLMGLSAAALVAVNIIDNKSDGYNGRYIYASDNATRIFDLEEEGNTIHVKYTISDDANNNYNGSGIVDGDGYEYEYYSDSIYGWNTGHPVRYAELEFDIPEEIIPKGVQVGLFDGNRYENDNVYMYLGSHVIYFYDSFDIGTYSYSGDNSLAAVDELHTINDNVSWNKAQQVRTDYSSEFMIIKFTAVILFALAASAFSIMTFKRMRAAVRIAAGAAIVIFAAISYVFILPRQIDGEYTVTGYNESVSTAELITYGKRCILMATGETGCRQVEFEKLGNRYEAVVDNYAQTAFSVPINSASKCGLRITSYGAKFTVENSVTDSYYRFDLNKGRPYTLVWFAQYIIWLPAVVAVVFMILYAAFDSKQRRLNPEYPYGDYRIKRLAYLDESMEYMRKYLRDNMEGVPVIWQKETFAVDGTVNNEPVYSVTKVLGAAAQIAGKSSVKQVDVTDSYCFLYSRHRTFLGTKIDNRVYTAYELEAYHE